MDGKTLTTVLALIAVMNTAVLLLLYRLHGRLPGLREWALSGICAATGLTLSSSRGIPGQFAAILVGNWFCFVSTVLMLVGMRRFLGLPPRTGALVTAATLAVLPVAAFPDLDAGADARVVIFSTVVGVVSAVVALTLARAPGLSSRLCSGLFGLNAVSFAVRIVRTLAHPSGIDYLKNGTATTAILLWAIVLMFANTFLLVLMVSERLRDELMHQAGHDPLTDIPNRRGFDLVAEKLFSNRSPDIRPFAVLMMDLDHFKRINDAYGHERGDEVLKRFSRILAATLRGEDVFARLGGEEFVALLPNCDCNEAFSAAERLRAALKTEMPDPPLTVSLGIACGDAGATLTDLMRRADTALYRAKEQGRDRAVIAEAAGF
jgi:diguanylate cyclase (GGDEF)-like protein